MIEKILSCFIVISIFLVTVSFVRNNPASQPILVFNSVWCLALVGYHFIDLMPGFEYYNVTKGSIIFIESIGLVYMFAWVVFSNWMNSNFQKIREKIRILSRRRLVGEANDYYDYRLAFRAVLFLGAIGLINNLNNVLSAGGFSIYADFSLRDVEAIFGASRFFNYFYFLNILAFMMLPVINRGGWISRRVYFGLLIYLLIALALHGVKSTVIFPLVGFYFVSRETSSVGVNKILYFIVFVSIAYFALVTFARLFGHIKSGVDERDVVESIVLTFVRYFSTGMVNLVLESHHADMFSIGVETFTSLGDFVKIFEPDFQLDNTFGATDLHLWNDAYNTGTFAREYIRDFGFFGLYLALIFQAGIFSFFYRVSYLDGKMGFILRAIVLLMHFGVFFSNHFLKLQYLFLVGFSLALKLVINEKQRGRSSNNLTR